MRTRRTSPPRRPGSPQTPRGPSTRLERLLAKLHPTVRSDLADHLDDLFFIHPSDLAQYEVIAIVAATLSGARAVAEARPDGWSAEVQRRLIGSLSTRIEIALRHTRPGDSIHPMLDAVTEAFDCARTSGQPTL